MGRALESGDVILEAHYPVALMSAFFLARDNDFSQTTRDAVFDQMGRLMSLKAQLLRPYSLGSPTASTASEKIANALSHVISDYRQGSVGGHHVIYGAMALKVCKEFPEIFTEDIVVKLCELIQAANQGSIETYNRDDLREYLGEFVEPSKIEDIVQNVLRKLNLDKGFHGHILTHGQALVDLVQLGYETVARSGFRGHMAHLISAQKWMKAETNPGKWRLRPVPHFPPTTPDYWEQESAGTDLWRGGHHFKVCYSFYEIKRRFPAHPLLPEAEDSLRWQL